MTVAVITGAASGIGEGLARHAASLGMKLVLADWDDAALTTVADSLPAEILAVPTDVRDEAAVQSLAQAAYQRFGEIDLVFNNAGVLSSGLTWEIDSATWQRSLDINIGGVVNVIRTFVPRLIAADRPARRLPDLTVHVALLGNQICHCRHYRSTGGRTVCAGQQGAGIAAGTRPSTKRHHGRGSTAPDRRIHGYAARDEC
jgi:NAD(P)-dependent dehydrogenase (short-subunit alcohol dehydrogenase family)